MIEDTSNGCGVPPPASGTHPAEWVMLGMAVPGLLFVVAAVMVGRANPAPECSITLPTTTIRATEQST